MNRFASANMWWLCHHLVRLKKGIFGRVVRSRRPTQVAELQQPFGRLPAFSGTFVAANRLDKQRTQRYSWVMIPDFDINRNLPAGIHDATIEEVRERYTYNPKRQKLFEGLLVVLTILRGCNCSEVFLDGSFITVKEEPGDYDLCYEPAGIVPTPEFHKFLLNRESTKERYLGDIFVRMPQPPYYFDHVEHWQTDSRQDDVVKGIIRISLRPDDNAQERKTIQ